MLKIQDNETNYLASLTTTLVLRVVISKSEYFECKYFKLNFPMSRVMSKYQDTKIKKMRSNESEYWYLTNSRGCIYFWKRLLIEEYM